MTSVSGAGEWVTGPGTVLRPGGEAAAVDVAECALSLPEGVLGPGHVTGGEEVAAAVDLVTGNAGAVPVTAAGAGVDLTTASAKGLAAAPKAANPAADLGTGRVHPGTEITDPGQNQSPSPSHQRGLDQSPQRGLGPSPQRGLGPSRQRGLDPNPSPSLQLSHLASQHPAQSPGPSPGREVARKVRPGKKFNKMEMTMTNLLPQAWMMNKLCHFLTDFIIVQNIC